MDPENLGPQIFDLNRTMNNKQCSQAESPPHLHNNTALILFLQQISSSSPIDQISKILRLVPEQHAQAESLFNLCKQTNAKELAEKLVQLIERSPRLHMRAMSAILLPNTLLQKPSKLRPSLWNTLPKLRSSVNLGLLNCVKDDQNKPIIIILANTISKLTADNRFPELKPFMFKGFNMPRDWVCCCCCCCFETVKWLKESALLIFAQLGDQYVEGYLVHHQTYLHGVFKDCLENGDIRITALSAVIKFIRCLTHTNMLSFKDLLPNMLKCVTEASNEATAQKVLLIELAGTWGRFFTEKWPDILTIATENSEEGTRHWAIELLITSVVSDKYDLPLLQLIINSLCEILMRMLLDIEDAGRSSNYIFVKRCLLRLVTAHPRVSLDALFQLSADLELSADLDPDLQVKYDIHVLPSLAKILGEAMCEVPVLVTLAANTVIVQLFAGLDPDLQFEYNSHVLPTLAEAMCEDPDIFVRLAAIDATVQLFANLDPDLPLTDEPHQSVLYALHGAICDFRDLPVQDRAVDAMIVISMNYPVVTPRYLRVTVGTLLELRLREDIALDQTKIGAIRNTLKAFKKKLRRVTWTKTFNRLRPEQQAEFRSIREEDDES